MTVSIVKIYLAIPQLWTICCDPLVSCRYVCPLVCQFTCPSVSRSFLSIKDTDDIYCGWLNFRGVPSFVVFVDSCRYLNVQNTLSPKIHLLRNDYSGGNIRTRGNIAS